MKSYCKILIVGGLILAGCGVSAAPAMRRAEPVRVSRVVEIPREVSRKYIAKISAVDDVSMVARISGVILEQKFASGDIVKKGQELIRLEDTTYVAAVKSAKAKLEQCKAEYEFAKRNLARQQTLWKSKATSESTYDEAVRSEASCKAAVSAAEAALMDAENNLSYTRIISPINGKTSRALYSPGNYVTPSSGTLVNIVSMDEMYVNFWISMNDYLAIFDGSFETLQKEAVARIFMADGSEFKGKSSIVFVDNRVDKDTDTIRIRILAANDRQLLLPDGLVTVRISRKDQKRAAVPVSAIMNNGKISFVYVLGDKNIPQVRPVELGEINGKMQLVLKGLKAGETVVVDGTHKVFPGAPVTPVAAKGE